MEQASERSHGPLTPTARFALYGAAAARGRPAPPAPYPAAYVERIQLADGAPVLLRPIRPDDEPLMVRFHEELGEESVFMRYAGSFQLDRRIDRERLARRCNIDYDHEMAIVAEAAAEDGEPRLLGIGRLIRISETAAEFGLVVLDSAHGKGLGTELLERLVRFGRQQGLESIEADILLRNRAMQHVARKLGFEIVHPAAADDPMARASLILKEEG